MSSRIKSPQVPNRNRRSNPSQKMKTSITHRPSPLRNRLANPQVTIIIRNIIKSIRNSIIIKPIKAINIKKTKRRYSRWPSIKVLSKVPKKRARRTLRKLRPRSKLRRRKFRSKLRRRESTKNKLNR